MEKKLNVDIPGAVTELESYTKGLMIRKIIYKIIFRGKGLEFDGYRDYAPDDDAADIDWKSSTRANKILVKRYIEERDLKILFIIDVSDNMLFGSTEKLKCEYAAELSAALGHLILDYGDNVGFVLFSDKIIKSAVPKKGTRQFDLFVNDLSSPSLYGGMQEIEKVLDSLIDYFNIPLDAVFILSDFIGVRKNAGKVFNLFASKFETMAIIIKDPLDRTMPDVKEELVVEDPITKKQIIINPAIIKKQYEKNALEQENIVKKIFKESDIEFLELTTDKPFALYLAEFLKERAEKRKYVVPKR